MALKIRWSPRAASNLEEICTYIAKDSEYYAILFATKVTTTIKTIPQFPKSGRIVPEYEDENLREKIYANTGSYIALKENWLKLSLSVMAQNHWKTYGKRLLHLMIGNIL